MKYLIFGNDLCVFAEFRQVLGSHLADPEGKGFVFNTLVPEVHALDDRTYFITILHQLLQNLHAHWCHKYFEIHQYFPREIIIERTMNAVYRARHDKVQDSDLDTCQLFEHHMRSHH